MSGTEIVLSVGLFVATISCGAISWQVKRQILRVDRIEAKSAESLAVAAAVEARQDAKIDAALLAASKAEDLVRETETRITKRLDDIAVKLDRLLERAS